LAGNTRGRESSFGTREGAEVIIKGTRSKKKEKLEIMSARIYRERNRGGK